MDLAGHDASKLRNLNGLCNLHQRFPLRTVIRFIYLRSLGFVIVFMNMDMFILSQ